MASFLVVGYIENIKYLPNGGGCLVFVTEFKKGYRKSDGSSVPDRFLSWKCIFKQGLVKYVNEHFNRGMLVEVKGEVVPYAVVKGVAVDGYSVIGQTLNLFSYPRFAEKVEAKMVKESMASMDETPDVDEFFKPDF